MSRWVGVGGVEVGGEPILIEKNASSSKKAPRIYAKSLTKHINICHL